MLLILKAKRKKKLRVKGFIAWNPFKAIWRSSHSFGFCVYAIPFSIWILYFETHFNSEKKKSFYLTFRHIFLSSLNLNFCTQFIVQKNFFRLFHFRLFSSFMLIHFYLIEHYLLSFIFSNTFLSFWRPETLTLFRFADLFSDPQNNNTYSTN